MPIRNQNWYDLQATRRYPLDDRSTGMDDAGNVIRDSVIVDCNIRFPDTAGQEAYVQAINVSGTIVTVLIGAATFNETNQAFDTTTIAAVSLAKPIVTNKNYPVTAITPGVAGWIVFGGGIAENFYGRYSTPLQSRLLTRCAKKYSALPVQSIGKSGLETALTDIVNIEVAAPIVLQKTTVVVTVNGITRTVPALEFSLAETIDSIGIRPAEYFLGPCGQRPESGTCPKTPIESINNVTPDCNGNINISADGVVGIYMFKDCGGLGVDLPRGLTEACDKKRYAAPLAATDDCAQDTQYENSSSSSAGVVAPTSSSSLQPGEQSSSSNGGGGGSGLTLPLCEPFNADLASILSMRRGNFISAAISAPNKCPSLPVLGLNRMPIRARMSITSPDWDNYITDHLGNILTTAAGDELIWATTTATAPSSASSSSATNISSSYSSSAGPEARCRLAMHMRGVANSTVFTDDSFFTNSVVVKGATRISNAQSRFGDTSAYFDGAAGAGLRVVGSAAQSIAPTAAANFTIEAWIYPEKDSGVLLGNYLGAGSWLVALASGRLRFTLSGSPSVTVTADAPVSLNAWTHIAICRSGGVVRLFCNGVLVGSAASTQTAFYVNNGGLGIGTLLLPTGASYGASNYQGYMNDLRIVQTALYPREFTPNEQAFTDCFDPAGELITISSSSESSTFAPSSSSSLSSSSSSSSAYFSSSLFDSSSSSIYSSSSSSAYFSSSSSSIYSSSSSSAYFSSSSSSIYSSSSSSGGLSLKIAAAADSVTTVNLATLINYATDWAINTDISTEFKIVPGATNNAGLVFNYTTSYAPSGRKLENYLLAKVDVDTDSFLLLRYNGYQFVTEYSLSLAGAGFKFDYAQWYKLTVSPTTITSSEAVAVTCSLEKLVPQQSVEFTVVVGSYGIPMGAPGVFADRAYTYFNKLTVV